MFPIHGLENEYELLIMYNESKRVGNPPDWMNEAIENLYPEQNLTEKPSETANKKIEDFRQ